MTVYSSPAAFRRALTDKLRAVAAPIGRWPLADLQRQFAYDRLVARLYLLDDGWILKGSTALLARRIAVRHTIDVDVYRAASRERAERDVRAAIEIDAGDWFVFEPGPGRPVVDGVSGTRIPINARIGAATWAAFHIDVVAEGVRMTEQPDVATALTAMVIDGLSQPRFLVYPLVDHIADKVCAILERHGVARRPSTRFKDLIDLVVLTAHAHPAASAQHAALVSEAGRRGLTLPDRFDVPDRSLWAAGYAAEARRSAAPVADTLVAALTQVKPYLDPLLAGRARGWWHPESLTWRPH